MSRTFTFAGFTAGSAVALSVAQNSKTASGSVSTWGQAPLGTVSIQTTIAPRPVAPAGAWLEAVNHAGLAPFEESGAQYDGAAQEYTHIWTVRGTPLPDFAAPENMLPDWNNPNIAYGRKVGFVFAEPGPYTIDLWVIDRNGAVAVADTMVSVQDPDALYPGSRTICFSNDAGETWAGEKAGCQRTTSIGDLQSRINAISGTGASHRVLFKRGQEVSDVAIGLFVNDDVDLFGAWGSGADPVLRPEPNRTMFTLDSDYANAQLTFDSLHLKGRWDPVTETGRAEPNPLTVFPKLNDTHLHLHGCTFEGFQQVQPIIRGGAIGVTDCVVKDWRDYGIYMNPQQRDIRFTMKGTRIAQHVDAMNGGDSSKNGLFNSHSAFRYAELTDAYIGVCDLFGRSGWSGLSPDSADNALFRGNTVSRPGAYIMVDRVVGEGGFKMFTTERASDSTTSSPGNIIYDKVLGIGNSRQPGQFIASQFGGTQVRNFLGIMPNVPPYHTTNPMASVLAFDPGNVFDPQNSSGPMALHSSTFLCLKDAANDLGDDWVLDDGREDFGTVITDNNILLAEGLDTPVTGAGPLETAAMPGITPRYKGVRFNFAVHDFTNGASVPDGGSFTVPYSAITEDLIGDTGGAATDQAYWLAVPDTNHTIMVKTPVASVSMFCADNGELSVSFGASAITITNTSGLTWDSNSTWRLRLDRASLAPAMQTAFASPATIPLPRPTSQSPILDTGDTGRRAYDDFLGKVRPGPGGTDHLGNPRPDTGNEPGALLQGT